MQHPRALRRRQLGVPLVALCALVSLVILFCFQPMTDFFFVSLEDDGEDGPLSTNTNSTAVQLPLPITHDKPLMPPSPSLPPSRPASKPSSSPAPPTHTHTPSSTYPPPAVSTKGSMTDEPVSRSRSRWTTTTVMGLVDRHTVQFALNWLCSWRARSSAGTLSSSTSSRSTVIFACADETCRSQLALAHCDTASGVDVVLLAQSKSGSAAGSDAHDVLLALFFELVAELAERGGDVVVLHDMRQVWLGDPLDFVHTHADRGLMDDLQTIGHPSLQWRHPVAFTKVTAKRSGPMPDPCAALVHVAGNSSAVVAFYRSVALKLLNASNKQPGPPSSSSSSLSAAVPSLCELADVRGMASGLRLRSFDPDLFHTDTAEALKRQAERRYKARVIPLIAPVVAYFPPQTGETAPEAISARVEAAMRQHQLWLRHDEGDRCVVLNESLWPGPDVPPEADDVRVVLKVLTYKRASSLQRLIRSLLDAEYDGDTVNLDIYVDYDAEENANVLKEANKLVWPHGRKRVINHGQNVGLIFQWLGCFTDSAYDGYDGSDKSSMRTAQIESDLSAFPLPPLPAKPLPHSEFAYIMEDDLEQSTQYYRWLKRLILHYHADRRNYSPRVYGATLQQQWLVPCSAPGSLKLPVFTNSTPFYYPLVGSWGTLAFPKQWEQFLHWFRQLRTEEPLFRPYINGTMPSRWFRGKQARLPLVLWTPWIIRFVAERGYTAMLSVFEDTSYSMSVNHLEKGVNYARKYNATHRVVPSYSESFFRMPPASDILAVNLCAAPIENHQALDGLYDALFIDRDELFPLHRSQLRSALRTPAPPSPSPSLPHLRKREHAQRKHAG